MIRRSSDCWKHWWEVFSCNPMCLWSCYHFTHYRHILYSMSLLPFYELQTYSYCTVCPYYHFTNYRHIVQYVLTILQITDILYSMFLLPSHLMACSLQIADILYSVILFITIVHIILYSMLLLPFYKVQTYCTVWSHLITSWQITDILYSMFLLPVCKLRTYCIVCSALM